jgi:16S rRNA (cytosine967-C5)-methyltransferase
VPEHNEYIQAVSLLDAVINQHHSLSFPADDSTTPLTKQLCYGVLRSYFELAFYRDQLLRKKLPRKHGDLDLLILCGIYSIRNLKRPPHASVNATVETTRSLNKSWASGMVNGVLRNFLRQQEKLEQIAADSPEARTNHPRWLLDMLEHQWPAFSDDIITANNLPAPMTLRVNARRTTLAAYLEQLVESSIVASPIPGAPFALQLAQPMPVEILPGFADGLVSVQDEASQLVAPLLAAEPGNQVLDACAAPGGKTCHLLELTPEIELLAIDKDPDRILQVEQNLIRLGHACKTEARDIINVTDRQFDRILLDVPCSATGIIRRHPDIKLLREEDDIVKLSTTQLRLLEHAWQLLSPGGLLVYATCSVLPHENEQVVSRFVASRDDITVLPVDIVQGHAREIGRQLFPQPDSHDGFYLARLQKADS